MEKMYVIVRTQQTNWKCGHSVGRETAGTGEKKQ